MGDPGGKGSDEAGPGFLPGLTAAGGRFWMPGLIDTGDAGVYDWACQVQPTILGADMASTAYGIVHFFPGGTKEQYEASIAAVHPGEGRLPEGQIFHAAGASAGGWTIMAVHDSKESWETFRNAILMPRLQAGVDGGFTSQPEETVVDLYKVMP